MGTRIKYLFLKIENFFVHNTNSVEGRKLNQASWKSIVRKQFELAHYGKISYESTQDIPVYEMNTLYNLLVEAKETEKQAYEEAKAPTNKGSKKVKSRKGRR